MSRSSAASSSSSISPSSSRIWAASSSSLSEPSSFISASTAEATLSRTKRMPPTRRLSMMIMAWSLRFRGPFQLEADVDEVVRRPGAGVLEDQVLVAGIDLLDLGVEVGLAVAGHQEGGVEDHLVADRLVGARGHGDAA